MVALGCLNEILKEKKKYSAQLEPLLVGHMFPEFSSPHGFLRARAAWMVQFFADIDFVDGQNVTVLVQYMLQALRDPCLPVQIEAANGLRFLIMIDGTETIFLPVLPDLLNEFFRIMAEIGSDTIVRALETIIEKFGTDIVPHAGLLVQRLCESFHQYAGPGEGGALGDAFNEDDEEVAMAAVQCVDAVVTVLDTITKSNAGAATINQILTVMEPALIGMLQLILHKSGDFLEYLESGLQIMEYTTFYLEPLSANYVHLLPLIVHAFHNWAYDYLPNMLSSLDNMVGRSSDLFIASSAPVHSRYQIINFIAHE